MKHVFCAQCGEKLEVFRKAVPSQQKVYEVIRPHNCDKVALEEMSEEVIEKIEEEEKKPPSTKLNKLFDSFKFVQKLDNLTPKPSSITEAHEETYGDKRDKDHLRKELLTSSAPTGLLDKIKDLSPSQAENDVNVEPKGD